MADLLDVATRAVAKKLPAFFATARSTFSSSTPAGKKFCFDEDPYEFIDEIDETSPTSYKEYSIKHSPVKVRRRLTLVRTAKIKKNKSARKSVRLTAQFCQEIFADGFE